jgi:hypothetical protein
MDTTTLINLLKSHDWYYHYSDDHSKWINGVQSQRAIYDAMDELGNTDDVKQLYYEYMPKHLFDKIEKSNAIHGEIL